jgi:hypothetical protein
MSASLNDFVNATFTSGDGFGDSYSCIAVRGTIQAIHCGHMTLHLGLCLLGTKNGAVCSCSSAVLSIFAFAGSYVKAMRSITCYLLRCFLKRSSLKTQLMDLACGVARWSSAEPCNVEQLHCLQITGKLCNAWQLSSGSFAVVLLVALVYLRCV